MARTQTLSSSALGLSFLHIFIIMAESLPNPHSPQASVPEFLSVDPYPGPTSHPDAHFNAIARTASSTRDSVTIVEDVDERRHPDEDPQTEFRHEAFGPQPGEKGWDKFEVRWEPDDPEDPHNWSRLKRWYLTAASGLLLLNAYVHRFDLLTLLA